MALINTLQLDVPGYGEVAIEGAYCLVVDAAYNKLTGVARWTLACFKDQAAREAYRSASDAAFAALAAYKVKDDALLALKTLPSDTVQQAQDKAAKRDRYVDGGGNMVRPQQERDQAFQAWTEAQKAVSAIKLLPQSGQQPPLGADLSPQVVTDGQIDLTKVYAFIKTQEGWTDAVDHL